MKPTADDDRVVSLARNNDGKLIEAGSPGARPVASAPFATPHRSQWRLSLILGALIAFVCLLILEIGVRVDDWRQSRYPRARAKELDILQANPEGTGSYRLQPNLNVETRVGTTPIKIRTNTHGMHWRETPMKREAGKERIAFLGDSFTFGCWASDYSSSFVGVFERSLSSGSFEALNFGVGGYGLVDHELLLKEVALKFDPAYVIVVSYMGNDFRDTWLGLQRENLVNGTARLSEENLRSRVPPAQLVDDDRVSLECPLPAWRRLARSSAAFNRLAPLLNLEDLCQRFRPNRNFLMPAFWSTLPFPGVAIQARDTVWESLERMETLAKNQGARLAVVALPTSAQVYAQEPTGRAFDTSFPQAHLQNFCRDRRIPYLDLLPLLRNQAAASNRRMYLNRDIHLNNFGHAMVAQFLARWFESSVRRRDENVP